MPTDRDELVIDQAIARKERGLLENDYASPCPVCGGVVFEWWDTDTCRDCDDPDDGLATEQTQLITDGGRSESGAQHTAGDSQDEEWLSVEADGSDGSPDAVAAVLESVAETLRESPDGKRYDFELEVEEL